MKPSIKKDILRNSQEKKKYKSPLSTRDEVIIVWHLSAPVAVHGFLVQFAPNDFRDAFAYTIGDSRKFLPSADVAC